MRSFGCVFYLHAVHAVHVVYVVIAVSLCVPSCYSVLVCVVWIHTFGNGSAWTSLRRYAPVWNAELVLRPMFLGGVMNATGNKPPAMLPARGSFLMKDISRNSRFYDVPMTIPATFPLNTIRTMRFLTAAQMDGTAPEGAVVDLTDVLYRKHWGEGVDVSTPEALTAAASAAGFEAFAERWLAGAASPEVKDRLKAATEEAVERGAYVDQRGVLCVRSTVYGVRVGRARATLPPPAPPPPLGPSQTDAALAIPWA